MFVWDHIHHKLKTYWSISNINQSFCGNVRCSMHWRIPAYLASGFIDLPLHKAMMHVVGDKAWQWIPVGSFSWEAFFKDDWGQNNLLEWCEWGITIPSRIEHFPSPSTSPFECTWDPDRRHWKKQTWEWKDFSRPVGDILPSHLPSQPTSLLNSGARWNHRARNVISWQSDHKKLVGSSAYIFFTMINGDRSIRRWHQKPTIEHCASISQPSIAIVPINNFDFLVRDWDWDIWACTVMNFLKKYAQATIS